MQVFTMAGAEGIEPSALGFGVARVKKYIPMLNGRLQVANAHLMLY